ncbi:MAG: methionyl-tRNA formyltransferase [Verrucomicrobia bacterium]|nr:methionyl-tRNA formyltransferase [Verrucomicrobiota bacterium]
MRVVFFGTGDIAIPSFRWLLNAPGIEVVALVTQPDKPVGRHQEVQPPEIKKLALERGVRVLQPVKMRAAESVAEVQALSADLIVVMAYGQILPKGVLDAAKVACLNLHASLLPRWRGAAPIQAAIEAGDEETGVAVMFMDEGLDTGDVLLMREIAIAPDETGGTLHDRLADLAPLALADAVALLREGRAPRTPQPAEGVTHVGKLTREHGQLDFSAGREVVARKVRAMNPWPAASTMLSGKRLKIFAATPLAEPVLGAGALQAREDGLLIGTGDGCVLVGDVQLEGKKRLSAREFLRGHAITDGGIAN